MPVATSESTNPFIERSTSVVIAEDHCVMRDLLVRYLRRQSHYTFAGEVSTGSEALHLCSTLHPDVLILDLGLPEVSGLDILPEVRKTSPRTKVLVFTGHNSPLLIKQAVMAGANGIIVKGSSLSVFLAGMEQVAEAKAFFCPLATQALHTTLLLGAAADGKDTLSLREQQVLRMVAEGDSTKNIAARLGISPRTAENHRNRLLSKLGAHNAADLTRMAFQLGLMLEAGQSEILSPSHLNGRAI